MMRTVQTGPLAVLPELASLQDQSLGDPEVRIAILDGPVDISHPCFRGANLARFDTMVPHGAAVGPMSRHGTHVASLLFGQPGGPVLGASPRCRGLILPIFRNDESHLSQLDLARAIERAVQEGAHIINISGGERSPKGQANDILVRAVQLCERNNVLIVAAVGNDGCECLHVPAALPGVLAVGAIGANSHPLNFSNWGQVYRANGVLAPGENILGAVPGGIASFTGSSFAAPIVSGVAALLLSIQRQSGKMLDPGAIREAILGSAVPCDPRNTPDCSRYLAGHLNIPGAYALVKRVGRKTVSSSDSSMTTQIAGPIAISADTSFETNPQTGVRPAGVEPSCGLMSTPPVQDSAALPSSDSAAQPSANRGIVPSCGCAGVATSKVFALGIVSYDFGSEARRDSFRQLMPAVGGNPPNPYDPGQLCDYLEANPSECTKLLWTLNLDATPLYAVEPEMPFAELLYMQLVRTLRGESLRQDDDNFVGRVSLPGILTNRTVRLFSGQTVPVVVAPLRGFYSWNESALLSAVKASLPEPPQGTDPGTVDVYIRNFLNKVYFEFRNLGQNPADRALNYSATNLFQLGSALAGIINPRFLIPNITEGTLYAFDSIAVVKSPYCRIDSDCWDVQLTFFNPENDQTANLVAQFTVDVSDVMPVTLGPIRFWTTKPN